MSAYSQYYKDVRGLSTVDVYRVLTLFEVTDPCLQHAVKKLLCAGKRGVKDAQNDIEEAISSLERWCDMRDEEKCVTQHVCEGNCHNHETKLPMQQNINNTNPFIKKTLNLWKDGAVENLVNVPNGQNDSHINQKAVLTMFNYLGTWQAYGGGNAEKINDQIIQRLFNMLAACCPAPFQKILNGYIVNDVKTVDLIEKVDNYRALTLMLIFVLRGDTGARANALARLKKVCPDMVKQYLPQDVCRDIEKGEGDE